MTDSIPSDTFKTNTVFDAALAVLAADDMNDFEVRIVTEYERKGSLSTSPLNAPNTSYGSADDDLLVSVQVRVPGYMYGGHTEVTKLLTFARTELTERKEAEEKAEIVRREAEISARLKSIAVNQKKVVELEAELAALKK